MNLHAPGTLLDQGRYRILELVGKGGMGAVYKARDTRLSEKVVAVKQVLDEADEVDPDFAEKQLKTECETLEKLRHPGIPQVLDAFREGNANHIVMEFIEGTSLEKLLEHFLSLGSPMPQEMVIDLSLKICDILIYLHEQDPPVIHRDIKPQNVLVRESNQEVVLVDFGLARKSVGDVTRSLVGTLGYAPIEQFKGAPELRSDLYGLGATMHHLICGKAPIPFQIPPLREAYPKAHPALAAVVDRCCQEKPDRRYANAQTVKAALKKALGEITGIYEDLPLTATAQEALIVPPNQTMPPALFAVLAICVLLGGGGLIFGLSAMKSLPPASPTPSPVALSSQAPPPPPGAPQVMNVPPPPDRPVFQPRDAASTPVELTGVAPAMAEAARGWFTPSSQGAWQLVASNRLNEQGSLLAEPGRPAGALFHRVAQVAPRRFSVRLRRQAPCDVQIGLGDLAILSRFDPNSRQFGTQVQDMRGGSSEVLLESESEGMDSVYSLDWDQQGFFTLTAGSQQGRFGGSPLSNPETMTILLAAPEAGMVTIDFADIETD